MARNSLYRIYAIGALTLVLAPMHVLKAQNEDKTRQQNSASQTIVTINQVSDGASQARQAAAAVTSVPADAVVPKTYTTVFPIDTSGNNLRISENDVCNYISTSTDASKGKVIGNSGIHFDNAHAYVVSIYTRPVSEYGGYIGALQDATTPASNGLYFDNEHVVIFNRPLTTAEIGDGRKWDGTRIKL